VPPTVPHSDDDALTLERFLGLASARLGHFRLESGHHSDVWFDLNGLFTDDERIAPFVAALANRLRHHAPAAVCGPLTGGAFLAQRIALELRIPFLFTERIAPYIAEGVYSVRYLLPKSAAARTRNLRIAIVDDMMSAGSALRGTYEDVRVHGGDIVVVGALMVLGDVGAGFFRQRDVPIEAVLRYARKIWAPDECELCRSGLAIDDRPS